MNDIYQINLTNFRKKNIHNEKGQFIAAEDRDYL